MSLALLLACAMSAEPAVLDAWRPVLAQAQLEPAALHQEAAAVAPFVAGANRLPVWDQLAGDPFLAPTYARLAARNFGDEAGSVAKVLERLGQRSGLGVTRSFQTDLLARLRGRLDAKDPLGSALHRFRLAAGGQPTLAADPATADLPPALAGAMGLLLAAEETALAWRARAWEAVPAAELPRALDDLRRFAQPGGDDDAPGPIGAESFAQQRRLDRLVAGLDIAALAAAADDLALAVDAARAQLAGQDLSAVPPRRWATPLGDVILGGSGDDTYEAAPLLAVDVAGNDTWHTGAAAAAVDRPVSVVLDLAGNDTYEAAAKQPAFGAAIGGVALQVDLAGNDRYRAGSVAEGCGIGGVGLLVDASGDDEYFGEAHVQGAAAFGLGLLVDGGGDDAYHAAHRGQGYGYTLGAGLLLDVGTGRDLYLVEDPQLHFPSAQEPKASTSLAQGCGCGRRSDLTDGHSLAGGLGWLVDGGGDDEYRGGVFAQGVGFWYGVGLLCDLAGNDTRSAVWYAQGAGAHAGIGIAWDGAGNDHWTATRNMAQGAGHDFSLGWLVDEAGDDQYDGPNLSLGAGNANGWGFCWDRGGADRYTVTRGSVAVGAATSGNPAQLAASLRSVLPS